MEAGLRARVGDVLDDWVIRVASRDGIHYRLTFRDPGEDEDEHLEIELTSRSKADRSRELASTLAAIIEARTVRNPRGFLVLETHLGLGPPHAPNLDLGVGLGGGAWLLRDHLQPRIRTAWSHSWAGELRVNRLDVGLGLAAGSAIPRTRDHLWVGGLLMPAFAWTHIDHGERHAIWSGGGELDLLIQYRQPWLVIGVRTGIETTLPAIHHLGSPSVVRYGNVRWLLALELGLGFPG